MPKIQYIEKRFAPASVNLIDAAETIINEYADEGFDLTLRQLYYQFVARDWIDNTQQSYKRLGSIIADARNAGLLDWNAITDRTRTLRGVNTYDGPGQFLRTMVDQFAIDLWRGQAFRPEVWIEKDALIDVVRRAAVPFQVDFFSCRGYTSASEIWSAGQRLRRYYNNGQSPVVIHLGDHDPSGVDMSRDIEDRLSLYSGRRTSVVRIALTMKQIKKHNPPPNPAKFTDSRCKEYVKKYGSESWELDALDPATLVALITKHIRGFIRDPDLFDERKRLQEMQRESIETAAARLDDEIDEASGFDDDESGGGTE